MSKEINLTDLWPNFSSIGNAPLLSDQLSAIFVIVLLIVFAFFLSISFIALAKSIRQTSWLITLVKGESSSTVLTKRHEYLEKAEKVNFQAGHLWSEFDETLIEVEVDGKTNLYNTIDSHHFFNSSTLATGITESRMLAAVPGFLTALGVIGTFIGLQLGLSQLNIGADAEVKEMMEGVGGVINGAKIAFMTSVWGVALSVLFNFIEKGLEQVARRKIRQLQTIIDDLFPRLSAECQLQRIADDGEQSRESLQGLAEKIGDKMQETLLEATTGMQEAISASLLEILTPVLDSVKGGSESTMDGLIKEFLDKFGEQGSQQRDSMNKASESVTGAVKDLSDSMTTFITDLKASQDMSEDREKELIQSISSQVGHLVEQNEEQSKILTTFVKDQLDGLTDKFDKREQAATAQSAEVRTSTDALLERLEKGMNSHFDQSRMLIDQAEHLQLSLTETVAASKESNSALKSSSNELNMASKEMKEFGSELSVAGEKLSEAVVTAAVSTSSLAQENQSARDLLEKNIQTIVNEREQLDKAGDKLSLLIDSADNSFEKMNAHQKVYLNGLQENVKELASQMTKLLTDYAEQANSQTAEHLNVWAKGTTNYAAQMNGAVQSLASIVDEIEDKLNS